MKSEQARAWVNELHARDEAIDEQERDFLLALLDEHEARRKGSAKSEHEAVARIMEEM